MKSESFQLRPPVLKVSVDQFSWNRCIPIENPQGGGADISSVPEKKLGSEAFVKYWQSQPFDSPALDRAKG